MFGGPEEEKVVKQGKYHGQRHRGEQVHSALGSGSQWGWLPGREALEVRVGLRMTKVLFSPLRS